MARTDLGKIELLVLDVDGVLTDGRVTLTSGGEEIKSFHVRDGAGMKYWRRVGKKLAVITGRGSPAVMKRCEELGVDVVRLNALDKLPAYKDVLGELGLLPEAAAVVGDDLPDLPMMLQCGFAAAPADAAPEVCKAADYVAKLPAGAGCVRDVIEHILKAGKLWQEVLGRYMPADEGQAV